MPLQPRLVSSLALAVAIGLMVSGCLAGTPSSDVPIPATATIERSTIAIAPTAIVSATMPPSIVTVSPAPPTVVATIPKPEEPSATPHPMEPATIEGLVARVYPGGTVEILRTLETTPDYTRYAIAYPSDGLRITGIMQVPAGEAPFPVIILNHGYYDRDTYTSGMGTWQIADYLSRQGYLTLAPDYRSWGESDWAPSLFHSGLVADVINLISSLPSIPQADPSRIGVWGHSMGGGIATKMLTIDPRIRAAVLHAPNSADDADLIARWGRGCLPGESEPGTMCNPADIIPPDLPDVIVQAYLEAAADPIMLSRIAPIGYLDRISAPVQIHIGTADGASLAATPPDWSFKLAEALERSDRHVELYAYDGQGHFLADQAWVDMAERSATFFDVWVKPSR